jgi:hypothetical protein
MIRGLEWFGDFLYVWWRWRECSEKDVELLLFGGLILWLGWIIEDFYVLSGIKDPL